MRKHPLLVAVVLASLGTALLCLCILGIVAIHYIPPLMERVGMADRYTTEFDMPAQGSLAIANPRGDIVVQTGNVQRVQVEATKIAHALSETQARRILARTMVRVDPQQARIDIRLPRPLLAKAPKVNLIVTAPPNTALKVSSQNGSIRVTLPPEARFVLDAKTGQGRIECAFPLNGQESGFSGRRERGQWLKGNSTEGTDTYLLLRAGAGDIRIEPLE